MGVEGEGGVIMTKVDEVEDVLFLWGRCSMKVRAYWKEAELKRVEDIVRGGLVSKKAYGLSCEC